MVNEAVRLLSLIRLHATAKGLGFRLELRTETVWGARRGFQGRHMTAAIRSPSAFPNDSLSRKFEITALFD